MASGENQEKRFAVSDPTAVAGTKQLHVEKPLVQPQTAPTQSGARSLFPRLLEEESNNDILKSGCTEV